MLSFLEKMESSKKMIVAFPFKGKGVETPLGYLKSAWMKLFLAIQQPHSIECVARATGGRGSSRRGPQRKLFVEINMYY